MPLTPIEPTAPPPSRARRPALAAAVVVALLIVVALVVRSNNDPARDRVETAASEDQIAPAPASTQRPGRPPGQGSSAPQQPDATVAPRPAGSVPPSPTNPFVATDPARPNPAPTPADGISGAPPTITVTTEVEPTGPTTTSTQVQNLEPPIQGPTDEEGTGKVPPEPTEPPGPIEPIDPTEQERCATLGGVAIGDNTDGDPFAIAARSRFRAAMPRIPETEGFQCGSKPLARFLDDLLIQRIRVAGEGFGILVAGLEPSDPVLWLSEVEWTSYKRMEPWDATHNFTGVPVERTVVGGHQTIRTSKGAVVMVRADSWGHTVLSGAWDVWMANGGPAGPMGLPEGLPTADSEGTHQDFTNGVLRLPGVTSKLEAEAMPASRYEWVPLTGEQRDTPPPAPHTIQDVGGVSYYVDRAGVRHWIVTTNDFFCARDRLGAKYQRVHGWQAAKTPLAAAFTCPPKPPA